MYFINCFIYTINKILKFKVVLLSLSGSECTLVNIQNSLRAFWSPDIFPALFHTWVCCSCWKKRIKMSAPSTPRGRKRSRGSPPREYILINAIIISFVDFSALILHHAFSHSIFTSKKCRSVLHSGPSKLLWPMSTSWNFARQYVDKFDYLFIWNEYLKKKKLIDVGWSCIREGWKKYVTFFAHLWLIMPSSDG